MPTPRRCSLDSSPSEAQPFLLELARRQAERRSPATVLARYGADRFVEPSAVDQRLLHRLAGLALDATPEFAALQLSPVAPLGACSVLAPTSQHRVLSAQRGTEVVSDPTNVLALECARRLRVRPDEAVRLCSVHQVLRAQPVPPVPGFSQHFTLFVMVEAGRARAEDEFEIAASVRQLEACDRIARACERDAIALPPRRVLVLHGDATAALANRVADALGDALPRLPIVIEAGVADYYDGLRVRYDLETEDGPMPLGDLGRFDWIAQLTSNRRLRFVASGFGLQMLATRFGTTVA